MSSSFPWFNAFGRSVERSAFGATGHAATLAALIAATFTAGPAAAQGTPAPAPVESLAVLPLSVTDLQVNDVQRLNALTRERVGESSQLRVQDEATTTKLIESAQSLGLNCDVTSIACAAQLGELADVSFVLVGNAAKLGDMIGFDVVVVDVKKKTQFRRGSRLVHADPDGQTRGISAVFSALFDEKARGSLTITSMPAGATVIIDGTKRGVTPLDHVDGLLAGSHDVRIAYDKFESHVERLAFAAGDSANLDVTLVPMTLDRAPRSLVQLSMPWGVVAGGLVLLAGAVTAMVAGLSVLATFDAASAIHTEAQRDAVNNADVLREQWLIMEESSERLNSWGWPAIIGGALGTTAGAVAVLGGGVWGGLILADEFLLE